MAARQAGAESGGGGDAEQLAVVEVPMAIDRSRLASSRERPRQCSRPLLMVECGPCRPDGRLLPKSSRALAPTQRGCRLPPTRCSRDDRLELALVWPVRNRTSAFEDGRFDGNECQTVPRPTRRRRGVFRSARPKQTSESRPDGTTDRMASLDFGPSWRSSDPTIRRSGRGVGLAPTTRCRDSRPPRHPQGPAGRPPTPLTSRHAPAHRGRRDPYRSSLAGDDARWSLVHAHDAADRCGRRPGNSWAMTSISRSVSAASRTCAPTRSS